MKFVRDSGLTNLFQTEYMNIESVIKQCKSKLIEIDKGKWHSNLFNDTGQVNGNKLRTYSIYKTFLEPEAYVKLPLIRDHRRILAMFRCGNLPLYIETGRFARPKYPLMNVHAFIVKMSLKMKYISFLNVPSMIILEEICFKRPIFVTQILMLLILLTN